jgi:hypothetical protein
MRIGGQARPEQEALPESGGAWVFRFTEITESGLGLSHARQGWVWESSDFILN